MALDDVYTSTQRVKSRFSRRPLPVLEAAGYAQRVADCNINEISKLPMPEKLACKPGCDHCCSIEVGITVPEAFFIADHLRQTYNVVEVKDKLRESIAKADGKRATTGRPLIPCVFLKDHQCSIYSVRPITCRRFTSYSEELCRFCFHEANGDSMIPHAITHEFAVSQVMLGMFQALIEQKLSYFLIEMNEALLLILNDFEGTLKAWLDRKPVFKHCELPMYKPEGVTTEVKDIPISPYKVESIINKLYRDEFNCVKDWDLQKYIKEIKDCFAKGAVPGGAIPKLTPNGK